MKRIALFLVSIALCGATSFAGEMSNSATRSTWEWSVNAGRLTNYLELGSNQYDEVSAACEYFADNLLRAARSKNEASRAELVRKAVLGNLKLMRNALDNQQYKKYVTLLNLTLHNKGLNVYLD